MTTGSLLLADVHLLASPKSDPIVCDLYIDDRKVAAIEEPGKSRQATDEVLPCSEHVAIPGLANLHLHCRPARALSDGLPVPEWHRRVDLLSRQMNEHDSYVGGLLAFGELLLSGVTTCAVMTRHFPGAARAAETIGLRAVVVPLAGDGGGVERGDLDDLDSSLQTVRSYGDPDGRVQMWPGFDSPLTTSLDGMRDVARTAADENLGIHTHMAETAYEVETFVTKRGLSEPSALHQTGILGPRTLLAHCNWLQDEDIGLLAETSTSVVHNPTSNMRFASGLCRLFDLRDAGVNVALGTDGMLSSYELNMFSAMRTAARLHRMTSGDSARLNSKELLEMTTSVPARIVGTEAGRLEPGAPADIAVLDMTAVHLQPYRRDPLNDVDLSNLIVWCAEPADVQHVVCGGEILVRDRRLTRISAEDIRREAVATDERLRPLIT